MKKQIAGVTRVTRFQALDGSEHETYTAAQRHNSETELARWLDEYLGENSAHGELLVRADEFAKALKEHWNISRKKAGTQT